jgi:hypothetical protein
MAVHDWRRVPAGIFHHFHHEWISQIALALNGGILPEGYYSLAEQHAAGFGPDVLTLQMSPPPEDSASGGPVSTKLAKPRLQPTGESELDFYRRKQKVIAVRHVSDDRIVAVIEIVSPGNKSSRSALRSFIDKAAQLLEQRIHLLIVDVFPPGKRDPQGIHGAPWEELTGESYTLPPSQPLALASYEADLSTRAYVSSFAMGAALLDMPLFLEPGGCIEVPLDATYGRAFDAVPKRWRDLLGERGASAP